MLPIVKSSQLYSFIWLPLLGLAGCASLPDALQPLATAEPVTETVSLPPTPEVQLLTRLSGAAEGFEILLAEGVRAVANEPYPAASGRTCRRVRLDYPDGRVAHRLACEIDGRWQWVPAVILQQNG